MAGLADLLTSGSRGPTSPRGAQPSGPPDARLQDLFGRPLQLRPAPRSRPPATLAGVPLRDDEQLQQWLQAHLDAQAAQAGEPPPRVADVAPTVSSRRRYALSLLRERMAPELQRGPPQYRKKVADTLRTLEELDLGI